MITRRANVLASQPGNRVITRRRIVIALGAGALAPRAAFAQQPGKVHRIAFLSSESSANARERDRLQALLQGLRNYGYHEGKNLEIEARWAAGDYDRLPQLATELVRLKVDVIVASGIKSTVAARRATATIPIVLPSTSSDPIAMGLAASLPRPGGNVTGSGMFGPEIAAKRLELLKEVLPRIAQVAVLFNPANGSFGPTLDAMNATAKSLKLTLQPLEVKAPGEFDSVIRPLSKKRIDAILVQDDTLFATNARALADTIAHTRLPAAGSKDFGNAGGLIGYGADNLELFRNAAAFVDKILKGAKAGDLPIERATKFDLVINMKTAKALGIKIPQSILVQATRTIE